MLSEEERIRLIHECRTALLNRMFDESSQRLGSGAEHVSGEIVAIAQATRALAIEFAKMESALIQSRLVS